MAYTTPRTWVAGEYPTAAQLNANVRDNVSFLANPPACRVYNSGTQSIPNTTATVLTFNSERYDTASLHSTSVDTSRLTIPVAGLYLVGATVSFQGNATGRRSVTIRGDGATTIVSNNLPAVGGGVETTININTVWKLAASSFLEVVVYQDSGGALNSLVGSGVHPEFWATWVGLG